MALTPNFGFEVPVGTDTVNLLTQCYPNFTSLDTILKAIQDAGVTTATATKSTTVFNVVRTVTSCNVFRFVATANYVSGDTFTVDGVSVTATAVDGTALDTGAFVINQSVVGILNGTVLTVLVKGGSVNASGISYDNTASGLTATDVQNAIDELVTMIESISLTASNVSYDNTGSGLTASNVQDAIDEIKTLISSNNYITTGLSIVSNRCVINDGGYYIDDNDIVHVDIIVTMLTPVVDPYGVVIGFPESTATSDVDVTAPFNNLVLKADYTGRHDVFLRVNTSINAGETRHFIGSYQKKSI